MDDFSDLVKVSRLAGERFDLVQAGGGNTSVKLPDGRLFVKASGMALSDVTGSGDFCCVRWPQLVEYLDSIGDLAGVTELAKLEAQSKEKVQEACEPSPKRPSIETLLHCLLGPLTLHSHPVCVAATVCRSDWKQSLQNIFNENAFFVDYKTPGAALALALRNELKNRDWNFGQPAIVFLQNHGMIVAARSADEAMRMTDDAVSSIAKMLGTDLTKYSLVNFVSGIVNEVCKTNWLAYLSDDRILTEVASNQPSLLTAGCATPDQLVYCGKTAMLLDSVQPSTAKTVVQKFYNDHKHAPKVVLLKTKSGAHVFLLNTTLRKCKEMEDVLKSHVMLQSSGAAGAMQYLPQSELDYLGNWEAEKYRQNL